MHTVSRILKIKSVNISEKKGSVKIPAGEISINELGVDGDAHSGKWHRQISLLGTESIARFSTEAGRSILPGEFAENITTEGMELITVQPLDRFTSGEVILEITQIGKKCHGDNCAIYREVGNCVMPKEGIFCRVVHGGTIKNGDDLNFTPKNYRCMVITLSDRASSGDYEDRSGPALMKGLEGFFSLNNWGYSIENHVIPDESSLLRNLLRMAEEEEVDFVFTTGGTGIGPRDITPDVVAPLLDKEMPGIMDAIRLKYGMDKPNALLTRSLAGVMSKSLVFCLPGSERAVVEYFSEIQKSLKHMVYMLHQLDSH